MVSGSLTDLLRKLLRVGEDNGVQHPTKALLLFAITGLVYVTVCLRFGLVSSTNHIVAAYACSDGDLELARARESSIPTIIKNSSMYYLHVPKTGSSFQTAMLRAVCPDMPEFNFASDVRGLKGKPCRDRFQYFVGGHPPFKHFPDHPAVENLVFLMRDPLERVISGYFHFFHDCGGYGIHGHSEQVKYMRVKFDPSTLLSYAKCVDGCTVNMLTGKNCGSGKPSSLQVQNATEIVHNAQFIGLTEQWVATVNLFAQRYSVPSILQLPEIYKNMRPGLAENHEVIEAREFLSNHPNFSDSDQTIYLQAKKRFETEVSCWA